jgi:hypothetical protein
MSATDAVANYVRTEWASHGVEVQATGVRSLTLVLPPELLGMTELCFELWNSFGATTDFKHTDGGATITVWIPTTQVQPNPKGTIFGWTAAICIVVGIGMSLALSDSGSAVWAHVASWGTPHAEAKK